MIVYHLSRFLKRMVNRPNPNTAPWQRGAWNQDSTDRSARLRGGPCAPIVQHPCFLSTFFRIVWREPGNPHRFVFAGRSAGPGIGFAGLAALRENVIIGTVTFSAIGALVTVPIHSCLFIHSSALFPRFSRCSAPDRPSRAIRRVMHVWCSPEILCVRAASRLSVTRL